MVGVQGFKPARKRRHVAMNRSGGLLPKNKRAGTPHFRGNSGSHFLKAESRLYAAIPSLKRSTLIYHLKLLPLPIDKYLSSISFFAQPPRLSGIQALYLFYWFLSSIQWTQSTNSARYLHSILSNLFEKYFTNTNSN